MELAAMRPDDSQKIELSKPEPADEAPAEDPGPHGTTPQIGGVSTGGRKGGLKPLAEGTVLVNRYDIVRKIGGGGMGAVYLATDRNLGGVLRAIKEMVQSHIEPEQQEKAIEDFKRESLILSTLDHPAIPTIYDYFFDEVESRFYLVMKYISGGDLAGRIRSAREGKIDERTVTEWAYQVADVLDYLHNLPTTIVYRDLKPSNIMLDGNTGKVMLIDFGIARSINAQEKGVTAVGTMGYAPPELFSGNVEPRSDIYSLGSTMFHLLTGADPQNNPLLIFDFQKNPRPRQINSQLTDQMERILMRAVEYNADARFTSAAEMREALGQHLQNLRSGQVSYGVTAAPEAVGLANQSVFCGFCGQRIIATDLFCAFCGSRQPMAQHGVHVEQYRPPKTTAKLVLLGTDALDSPAYTIEKAENLVGRRDPMSNIFPEVDLSKYDPQTKVSRRHAKIWRDGPNYLVEDLGSSNGTIILSEPNVTQRLAPHMPHRLNHGDKLRLGDMTLHFVVK
jgi:eukaryotic-like serine/threonine-protein kinase